MALLKCMVTTGEKNDGSFPKSHSSYTGYLPLENTQIGKVKIREATDKAWGQGKYSIPEFVPPSNKNERERTEAESEY